MNAHDSLLLAVNSVNYFTMIFAIADLFYVAYVGSSPSEASHSQAGVHFRNHLHLTHIRIILHPLLTK